MFSSRRSHPFDISKSEKNHTPVTEFYLLGFGELHSAKFISFFFFLIIYLATVLGNLLLIVAVAVEHKLHSPMYVFLTFLSLSDLLVITSVLPNLLYLLLSAGGTMSYAGCVTQFFLFGVSSVAESFLLTAMSYDRYVAICNPLHYGSIMNLRLCLCLVLWSWLLGLVLVSTTGTLVFSLYFCGPNTINHFFCDFVPLIELSCSDTYLVETVILLVSIPIAFVPLLFIVGTYICILHSILSVSSTIRRQKAFSTCSSHLTVVSSFYGAQLGLYVFPSKGHSLNANKVIALIYTVFTPMFNPMIYSLKSREIMLALRSIFFWRMTH
ncbi:PREDICTED: olfactory receptor 13G1-like [Nanorana parkeri]|uniref:olfactory receptor 13G1-like n=1 Tax=Nanorana parkeri TaxID=125878 RepID=UPI000854CD1B|nr:PREDICTED: olfactory receptor 13G1-like [Nanorana parkeri]